MGDGTTQRRHVARLETNIKRPVAIDLGRKVIVIGRNGTGKSGLVDAYSLVTTGEGHSPGIGKGNPIKEDGAWDQSEAYVEAMLSDGEVVRWPDGNIEGSDNAALASKYLFGDAKNLQTFILDGLASVIKAGEEKGKEWGDALVERSVAHVPGVFTDTLKGLVQQANEDAAKSGTTVDGLGDGVNHVLVYALAESKRKSALVREAQKSTEPIKPLTEEEQVELQLLTRLCDTAPDLDIEGAITRLSSLGMERKTAREHLCVEITNLQRQYDATQLECEKLRESHMLLDALRPGIEQLNIFTADKPANHTFSCPCCGGEMRAQTGRDRETQLDQAIRAVEDRLAGPDALENRLDEARKELASTDAVLETLRDKVRELLPHRKESGMGDRLAKLTERARLQTSANKLLVDVVETVRDVERLKAIVKGLQKLRAEITDSVLDVASARINRLLPTRIRVKVETTGARGQGCRVVGAVDGGEPKPFRLLGGAEKALVGAAMATAFASEGGDKVDALVIDEVWLDRPRVTDLISLIDDAIVQPTGPSQVILSVVEYEGRVPDDWCVVNLNASDEDENKDEAQDEVKATEAPPEVAETTPAIEDRQMSLLGAKKVTGHPSDVDAVAPDAEPATEETQNQAADAMLDALNKAKSANGGMELLGTVVRDESEVEVYFLGIFNRFTGKAKRGMSDCPNQNDGVLGVALSGKTLATKVVALVNGDVVDASIDQNVAANVEALIAPKRTN